MRPGHGPISPRTEPRTGILHIPCFLMLNQKQFDTELNSTQRDHDRLLGGHMHTFGPFQFK
jgi:hypothetical protein